MASTLGFTACRSADRPRPPRLVRLQHGSDLVVLSLPRTGAQTDEAWLASASRAALGRLAAYSLPLAEPVLVRLHTDVASFVAASGRTEHWLRAWASFAAVDLLHPRFWQDDGEGARVGRLAHELTHCAIYQAFGDERRARQARVPWWLAEGAASVVAAQEASRMPLARVVERSAGTNPLRDRALLGRDHHLAYGAAHHAVAYLVTTHGRDVVRRILDAAQHASLDDEPLPRALMAVTGLSVDELWGATARG